jgi:MoaA/NifB/PqqE/SkfB family radical SAM enzyme
LAVKSTAVKTLALKAPLLVKLELTDACNHACIHCYNPRRSTSAESIRYGSSGARREGSQAFLEEIVDKLGAAEIFDLNITGGEPFMAKQKLYSLLNRAAPYQFGVTISTNATRITPDDARALKEYDIRGVLVAFLTEDAQLYQQLTGSYHAHERTIRGIRTLQSEHIPVATNTVVTTRTLPTLERTLRMLIEDLGVREVYATKFMPSPLIPDSGALELGPADMQRMIEIMLKVKESYRRQLAGPLEPLPEWIYGLHPELGQLFPRRACPAGVSEIAIDVRGDIYSCAHLGRAYGNICSEPLDAIWSRIQDECSCAADVCRASGETLSVSAESITTGINNKFVLQQEDHQRANQLREQFLSSSSSGIDRYATKVHCVPHTRIRSESFGYTVYVSPRHHAFVNEGTIDLLQKISSSKSIDGVSILEINPHRDPLIDSVIDELLFKRIICPSANSPVYVNKTGALLEAMQ